jgi:predicted nucleic acid-binding protein
MAEGEACLLDSNILLRVSKSDDPQHAVIGRALRALVGQGARLCYTSQTLGEFWNAATRPLDKNGFGLTVAETDRLARIIERDLNSCRTAARFTSAGAPFWSRITFRACKSMTRVWQRACMSTAFGNC